MTIAQLDGLLFMVTSMLAMGMSLAMVQILPLLKNARLAKQFDQLPPTPGVQRVAFKPVAVPPPDWWAEALIPLDDL